MAVLFLPIGAARLKRKPMEDHGLQERYAYLE
jgi:hypothetical protein